MIERVCLFIPLGRVFAQLLSEIFNVIDPIVSNDVRYVSRCQRVSAPKYIGRVRMGSACQTPQSNRRNADPNSCFITSYYLVTAPGLEPGTPD
jgi:hypothetical protein